MTIDVTKITLSKGTAYYADAGTAGPADTVAVGGSWPVGWTHVGALSAPLILAYEYEVVEADIQDAIAPVARHKKSEKGRAETMLAEIAMEKLALPWDAKNTATAAGAGQPGKNTLTVGGKQRLTKRKWGFEGFWFDEDDDTTRPIRCYLHIATAAAGGQLEFDKGKYMGIALKLAALADLSQVEEEQLWQIVEITADATS